MSDLLIAQMNETVHSLVDENLRLDKESQRLSDQLGSCDRERRALMVENESLRRAIEEAEYRASQGKVWNGMGWTYTGLSSHTQQKVLDILRATISSPENPS